MRALKMRDIKSIADGFDASPDYVEKKTVLARLAHPSEFDKELLSGSFRKNLENFNFSKYKPTKGTIIVTDIAPLGKDGSGEDVSKSYTVAEYDWIDHYSELPTIHQDQRFEMTKVTKATEVTKELLEELGSTNGFTANVFFHDQHLNSKTNRELTLGEMFTDQGESLTKEEFYNTHKYRPAMSEEEKHIMKIRDTFNITGSIQGIDSFEDKTNFYLDNNKQIILCVKNKEGHRDSPKIKELDDDIYMELHTGLQHKSLRLRKFKEYNVCALPQEKINQLQHIASAKNKERDNDSYKLSSTSPNEKKLKNNNNRTNKI